MALLRCFRALGACTLLVAAAGCGGGSSSGPVSSSEAEPADKTAPGAVTNDTPETAEAITPGRPMFGTISDSADVDWFKFHATAGKLLTVDAYAARFDPASWSDSPQLRLFAPDGTTALYTNGPDQDLWASEDTGIALVPIPADGDYYVVIDGASNAAAAEYALRVALTSAPGSLQHEGETPEETGVNSTQETAEPIVPGVMAGFYANGDPDFYSFTVAQRTRVRFTLTADRNGVADNGSNDYDTYLRLYDADGTQIASNDDTWYLDSSVEAVLPAGDYAIEVDKYSLTTPTEPYLLEYEVLPLAAVDEAAGNDTTDTAMHLGYGTTVSGAFTADEHHLFAVSGTAGDLVRLYLLDPVSDGAFRDADGNELLHGESDGGSYFLQTILQTTGTFYLDLWGPGTAAPLLFRLERVAAAKYETEPNDSAETASGFGPGGWAAGVIDTAGDSDGWAFDAAADQLVTVALVARDAAAGAATDGHWGSSFHYPQLDIRDAAGNLIVTTTYGSSDTSPSSVVRPSSMIEAAFRAPAGGRYYAVVSSYDGEGSPTTYYALKLRKNE